MDPRLFRMNSQQFLKNLRLFQKNSRLSLIGSRLFLVILVSNLLPLLINPLSAMERATEEAAVAIRQDDDRKPLALPRAPERQRENEPGNLRIEASGCMDTNGTPRAGSSPFSETCKSPSSRY